MSYRKKILDGKIIFILGPESTDEDYKEVEIEIAKYIPGSAEIQVINDNETWEADEIKWDVDENGRLLPSLNNTVNFLVIDENLKDLFSCDIEGTIFLKKRPIWRNDEEKDYVPYEYPQCSIEADPADFAALRLYLENKCHLLVDSLTVKQAVILVVSNMYRF